MKKYCIMFLVTFICLFPLTVNAETLDQYIAKAEKNRADAEKAQNEKKLTEAERADAIAKKNKVTTEVNQTISDLEKMEKDITNLQASIQKKNKEIKEIMKFVQVSNGQSAYLEYAFGASNFTDFIYRISVAEQLSKYNDNLITGYNKDIKDLEQKQKDLTAKQFELKGKQKELAELESKLSNRIHIIQEGILDYESEYKNIMIYVNLLKSKGCQGNQTLAQCEEAAVKPPPVTPGGGGGAGGGNIEAPSTTGFYMPIPYGYVTSNFGWRDLSGDGKDDDYHNGLDVAGTGYGSNIYPVAAGTVIAVREPSYSGQCGNRIVYVAHNVNGKKYTTSYWHMISRNVSVGQDVSVNTVLGKMGGLHSGDECSYGVHVHLNLFNGYTASNSSTHLNPRSILPQAPAKGVYFSHR